MLAQDDDALIQQEKQIPKKRILVVSQHFWPETFRINDIVDGFREDGIEVDVLCGLPNYPSGEWFPGYRYTGPRREKYHGADVFRSGEVRRKNNTMVRIFLNYISFPVFSLFSLPRLRGRHYDAVFCYETAPVLMMLPAIVYAKTHKIPLTTYVLDLWPDNLYSVIPVKNKLLRWWAQSTSDWFYRRSDKLIAMSDALAAHLKKVTAHTRVHREVAVIPQYSEDFYAQDIQDEGLARRFEGTFNILFAGNISPPQNLDNLADAMRLVRRAGGNDIRCIIVGDGMSRNELEEYVQQQGVQQAFSFCGSVPATDVPQWTGMADALFAGLAKSENLGMTVPAKIASYFAAGKPMLVAADQEAARVSKESGAALVSPAGDAAALAENILRLRALAPQERALMGQHGRQCYERHYMRSLLLKKLEQFILGS